MLYVKLILSVKAVPRGTCYPHIAVLWATRKTLGKSMKTAGRSPFQHEGEVLGTHPLYNKHVFVE